MGRSSRGAAVVCTLIVLGVGDGTPAAAQAAAAETQKYRVEARFMFWADAAESQSLPDQEQTISDFFVRRVRVIAQARPTESLTLYFQVGQDNIGGKLLTDDGSIRIKDAYANYRASNSVQFCVGQFKIPFLRANLESGFNQLLVDRGTLPSLRPAREGLRDLGAMAWGNVHALQYRVALFDGSDQEARNSTSSLRASTRVAYNWFTNENGLSYTGSYLGSTRVLQVAGQLDVQGSRLDPRDEGSFVSRPRDYRALALEAFFEQPLARAAALTLDGAWFDRRDDYEDSSLATRRVQGHYVEAGFLLPGQIGRGRLQFAVRREAWDTDRGAIEVSTSRMSAGGTYFLKGHDRKLQADYTRKREPAEVRNDEFRLSVVIVF
jgi:hypothetical protein